jgi:hypothetical protein
MILTTLCSILLTALPQATAKAETPASAEQPAFAEQSICAVDGKALLNHDHHVDYEGMRTYLCDKPKCRQLFTAFPDKWLFALERKKQAPKNIQTHCAVSGAKLGEASVTIWMGNKSIQVGGEPCAKRFQIHPSFYIDKLEGRQSQEKCAVMGGDLNPNNSFAVQGTRVGQCCAPCEKKWRKEPAKFFTKLAKQKVVLQPVTAQCAVYPDKAAKAMHFATLGSRRFYFSDYKARTRFLLNPTGYAQKLADVAIGALPKKLPFPAPKATAAGKCPTP